jgi:hypothetical protein
VQARLDDLLDCPYFHVVFTVPSCLHALIRSNERSAYTALFRAAADTILECSANPKYLGAKPGFTGVLHTSGQNLSYHPHIHMIVCAGGIDAYGAFRRSSSKFFIPVKVLSRVFKGKLTSALKCLALNIEGKDDSKRIADLIDLAWGYAWVVYAKRPFRDAACAIEYLVRYTHKTAISNSRILVVGDGKVTFKWRDYRDNNTMKVMALAADEFIRRFFMHVVPSGFMRIRHYGFLANNDKCKQLEQIRRLTKMKMPAGRKLSGLEMSFRLSFALPPGCFFCPADLAQASPRDDLIYRNDASLLPRETLLLRFYFVSGFPIVTYLLTTAPKELLINNLTIYAGKWNSSKRDRLARFLCLSSPSPHR